MIKNGDVSQKTQQTVVEKLLLDEQLLVHVNPKVSGVQLPTHLAHNTSVTLRLSRYFRGSLTTDSQGVVAELLFGTTYHTCMLPWESIWGASSVRGEEFIWSEAAPPDVLGMVLERNKEAAGEATQSRIRSSPPVRSKANHLKRVK